MLPPPCLDRIEDFSKRKVWGRIVLQFRAGEIINVEVAESVTLERNGSAKQSAEKVEMKRT